MSTRAFFIGLCAALSLVVVGCSDDDDGGACSGPADCSDHGSCTDGACQCDTGYAGDHCERCDTDGGWADDGSGACVRCSDDDGDGHDGYHATECPAGDDYCDDDDTSHTEVDCLGCVDEDNDGHDAYHATACPAGDDQCDDDGNNWTQTGCDDCVDSDGDGYGVDCDRGADCDDNDIARHTGCGACYDGDGDGHDGYDAVACPSGDDHCDSDDDNWTATGCADCVDSDGDGFGVDCDRGADCDDGAAGHHDTCYRVYYWGDFNTAGVYQIGYREYPSNVTVTLPATGFDPTYPIVSVAVSPDGESVALAGWATSTGDPQIRVYSQGGTGFGVTVTSDDDVNVDYDELKFSPDGVWLAYKSDTITDNAFTLFVAPADGSAAPKRVAPDSVTPSSSVETFAWSPDTSTAARYIFFAGEPITNGDTGLWQVEVTDPSPMWSPIETDDVIEYAHLDFDAQNRVYYVKRNAADTAYWLYRYDTNSATSMPVPGTMLTNPGGDASVTNFALSPDGQRLAFAATVPSEDLMQVYVLDLSSTNAVAVSDASNLGLSGTFGPSYSKPIEWSQDGQHLGVSADWPVNGTSADGAFGVWVLPTSGPPDQYMLCGVITDASRDALQLGFGLDSAQLFFRADYLTNNEEELFMTDDLLTRQQPASGNTFIDAPTGGDVYGFLIAYFQR